MGKFFQGVKITQVHGKMKRVGDAFVIPMFHPAAALHQVALKPTIKQDFANLPKLLSMAKKELDHEKSPVTDPKVEPSESADLPAKQMKLL
jgi:DNA polymerase